MVTVGIPRGLFYYYHGSMWEYFFDRLGISYIVSPETNREIKELGCRYASDEMCLSLKIYIGHVAYLVDKCDAVIVPRIDNYGLDRQTCTNFLSCYDIINNLFDKKIIDYNICYTNGDDLKKGFYHLGSFFVNSKKKVREAYYYALCKSNKLFKKRCVINYNKLFKDGKKVLVVSHAYNTYDKFVGSFIISFLENSGCNVIYSDLFDKSECLKRSTFLCNGLYWEYSRDIIGALDICKDKVDGILFISTFPCGLDSIVNDLVIRKLNNKCLNLVIDDMDAMAGIETRLESFVDILG